MYECAKNIKEEKTDTAPDLEGCRETSWWELERDKS